MGKMQGKSELVDAGAARLFRLMADVAALRHDAALQRQSLVDGLQEIFKTKIGWMMVADNYRLGRPVVFLHQVITSNAMPG